MTAIGLQDAGITMQMQDWRKKLPVKVLRNIQSGKTARREEENKANVYIEETLAGPI